MPIIRKRETRGKPGNKSRREMDPPNKKSTRKQLGVISS